MRCPFKPYSWNQPGTHSQEEDNRVCEEGTARLGQARCGDCIASRALGGPESPVVPRAPQVVWGRKEKRGDTCRALGRTQRVVLL